MLDSIIYMMDTLRNTYASIYLDVFETYWFLLDNSGESATLFDLLLTVT